jgi:hypothetical protein
MCDAPYQWEGEKRRLFKHTARKQTLFPVLRIVASRLFSRAISYNTPALFVRKPIIDFRIISVRPTRLLCCSLRVAPLFLLRRLNVALFGCTEQLTYIRPRHCAEAPCWYPASAVSFSSKARNGGDDGADTRARPFSSFQPLQSGPV